MSNFSKRDPDIWGGDVIIPGVELSGAQEEIELGRRTCAFRHPFVLKLMELGILPQGCGEFSISFPVEGVVTIKATYFIEREPFERAIRETYQTAKPAARTKKRRSK